MTTPTSPQDWQGQPTPPPQGWQQPQGQPWPGPGQPYPQWQQPVRREKAPDPVPGAVGPRSRGLRAAILAVGATVAVLAVTTGAAGAIGRTHVHPFSQVGGEEPATSVTGLEVEAGVHDVVVTAHAGSMIEWQTGWYGDPDNVSIVERNGSTLSFTVDDDRWNWRTWDWFDNAGERQTLTIRVPEDLVPDLELDAGAGRVTVDGTWGDTVVRSGVGDVGITGEAASLRVESGVGRVQADVAVAGRVDIAGGVGTTRIDLGTTTAPESVIIEGGVGTVSVALPVLREGYAVTRSTGVGTVTENAPEADPRGIATSEQVPLTVSGGVGTVTVTESTSTH
ncbi:MAG: DUF4097 family beta strand repeat-containing protein [Actinomycetota bacterium]